jgi:Pyruvate/2-oxoacid:ferredoxin oxidoreductase gamma subunit
LKTPFNLFITGVGGQGVITLANVVWRMCELKGFFSTGSVIKGGAQRLGSVLATLRIFGPECANYREHSIDVPDGHLDVLIGLEPWEALRAYRLCGPDTKVIVNHAQVPLLVARTDPISIEDPVREMCNRGLHIEAQDYTQRAIEKHGQEKMMNYEIGLDAVRLGMPEFSIEEFDHCFGAMLSNVRGT